MNIIPKLESYSKVIPILYPLLIFIGFYDYFIYYEYFNIKIFNYLSTYELLFSFLSSTILVILSIFTFGLYLALIYTGGVDDENQKKEISEEKLSLVYGKHYTLLIKDLSLFTKCLKSLEIIKASSYIPSIISNVVLIIIRLAFWIFFLFYSLQLAILIVSNARIEKFYFIKDVSSFIFLSVIWLAIALAVLENRLRLLRVSRKIQRVLLLGILFILMFAFLSVKQKVNIKNVIENTNSTLVQFNYKGDLYLTDDCLVYLGKTSEYLFLRGLEDNSNYIFPLPDISHLKMRHSEK